MRPELAGGLWEGWRMSMAWSVEEREVEDTELMIAEERG